MQKPMASDPRTWPKHNREKGMERLTERLYVVDSHTNQPLAEIQSVVTSETQLSVSEVMAQLKPLLAAVMRAGAEADCQQHSAGIVIDDGSLSLWHHPTVDWIDGPSARDHLNFGPLAGVFAAGPYRLTMEFVTWLNNSHGQIDDE